MDTIVKIAAGELGQKEVQGSQHNSRILEYQEMTGLNFGNDEVAWCSIFANWVALQADVPRSNAANARSWLSVGRKTSHPWPGDVVVFWRNSPNSWQGHVGFFMGFDHDNNEVFCLGGNQNNEVNISKYPLSRVLQFRRLKPDESLDIPRGYLRKGDTGLNVKNLQRILIDKGYLQGTADGVFGENTEKALKQLQRDHQITVDGIYGNESRNVIFTLLNQ